MPLQALLSLIYEHRKYVFKNGKHKLRCCFWKHLLQIHLKSSSFQWDFQVKFGCLLVLILEIRIHVMGLLLFKDISKTQVRFQVRRVMLFLSHLLLLPFNQLYEYNLQGHLVDHIVQSNSHQENQVLFMLHQYIAISLTQLYKNQNK